MITVNSVLDTNVILDGLADFNLFNHNIVVPLAVIEELDRFKALKDNRGFHVRAFIRQLDGLPAADLFGAGALFNEKHTIRIALDAPENIPTDSQILLCAEASKPSGPVLIRTSDVLLRLRARALGLAAKGCQKKEFKVESGIRTIEDVPPDLISQIYKDGSIDPESLAIPLVKNESLILKSFNSSALAFYDFKHNLIRRLNPDRNFYGIAARNTAQHFALNLLVQKHIPLVTLSGKAGTGKTLLALAGALSMKRHYKKIYITRPATALDDEDLGALPGEIADKIAPYLMPFHDNLRVIQKCFSSIKPNAKPIKTMLEEKKIEILPLAYIRGRSLDNCFVIVDETQNLNEHKIKTILTRLGQNSKIVLTGDIGQIDKRDLNIRNNGIACTNKYMADDKFYGHVTLEKSERHEAINHIIENFEAGECF